MGHGSSRRCGCRWVGGGRGDGQRRGWSSGLELGAVRGEGGRRWEEGRDTGVTGRVRREGQ